MNNCGEKMLFIKFIRMKSAENKGRNFNRLSHFFNRGIGVHLNIK